MTTTIRNTTPTEIEYPDSDGKPMSDNSLQYKWMVTIREGIATRFLDDPKVYVEANLLWYAVEGKPTIRGAPDILVAFGRPKGHRGSYKQWVEGGIAPQVVFEILSPGNRAGEMRRKFQFYQRYGVEEYYVYNPDNGDMDGWLREGETLVKIPDMKGFVSPRLGIRFEPTPGYDTLTIFDKDGKRFLSWQEQFEEGERVRRFAETAELRAETAELRAETAELRAETAEQRAEEAKNRAETAEQRAERLAARLRELGIEPE